MVDSTTAVWTRVASRNLVDSIAIDLQLEQVEFICCSLTIETKELECSWSLAIVLQVQPEMKWNGWCVDEMSACLKSKTNVSSLIIINGTICTWNERATVRLGPTEWSICGSVHSTCHVSPINPLKTLTSSNSASALLPSTFTDCTNSHPPIPTTSTSSCCIISLHLGSRCCPRCLSWIDHVHLDLQEIWKWTLGDDCSCLDWECRYAQHPWKKKCQVVPVRSAK